ncbi:MAG: acetyl-CoA carboxylase carboxyltransferase subunit beta, partial [Myxococcaceae bacterium]
MASWFSKKPRISPVKPEDVESLRQQPSRMQGLWTKCEECNEIVYRAELEKNLNVCPLCGHHMPWPARARLAAMLDEGTFEETDRELEPTDPLGFTDTKKYRDRLRVTRRALEENDAFVGGLGRIEGHSVSVGAFVFEFMGGSMGWVVGEKVTRLFERATERRCAAVVFSASGGARMQEGIFSLMQMAKTS